MRHQWIGVLEFVGSAHLVAPPRIRGDQVGRAPGLPRRILRAVSRSRNPSRPLALAPLAQFATASGEGAAVRPRQFHPPGRTPLIRAALRRDTSGLSQGLAAW